jgi:sugar lactone lactonase YvrE
MRFLPLLLALVLAGFPAGAAQRPLGDVRVLAVVPPPGFPESLVVRGSRAYVSTPSRGGTAGQGPSKVFAFNARRGNLVRTYEIQGESLAQDHSLTNMAFDRAHRLYVLSNQLGLIRLNIKTGAQEPYASPPVNLPPCATVTPPTPCSPTVADAPPLANSIAFDGTGIAYVTDSGQATIYRIPPGGGAPQIWFQDPRIAGVVGPNGIRVSPDGQRIVVAVTFTGASQGFIYTLPLIDTPTAADLMTFHTYGTEGPDEIAFGRSGRLYVSLAVANAASVLDVGGNEIARYSGPASDGTPMDSPSGVALRGRSLLMNNHALFSGITANMVVFDIFVDDRPEPLLLPRIP